MSNSSFRMLPHAALFKWALYYGLLMGLAAIAGFFLTNWFVEKSLWVSLVAMGTYLAEFFIVYYGLKKYKETHRDFSFLHGFILAIYISFISALVLVLYTLLFYYVIDPGAMEADLAKREAAMLKEMPDNPEEVAHVMGIIRSFYAYILLAGSLISQLFIGLLSGLSSAFILKDQELKA